MRNAPELPLVSGEAEAREAVGWDALRRGALKWLRCCSSVTFTTSSITTIAAAPNAAGVKIFLPSIALRSNLSLVIVRATTILLTSVPGLSLGLMSNACVAFGSVFSRTNLLGEVKEGVKL